MRNINSSSFSQLRLLRQLPLLILTNISTYLFISMVSTASDFRLTASSVCQVQLSRQLQQRPQLFQWPRAVLAVVEFL
jgi:hypothetical protein